MAKKSKKQTGFSLIEMIVAILILAIASLGILGMFEFSLKVVAESKAKVGAVTIANEILETARNLPYNDVGTVGGLVGGVIPQQDIVNLNGINYTTSVSVDYVDDPFDGTVDLGTDELGNDYKKVRVAISWQSHFGNKEIISITTVAPKGIESDEGSGVLWINAINASGEAVPNASIHIVNDETSPTIDDSSHQTNDQGYYYSSVPISNSAYQITITKDGYSSDYTCTIDPGGLGCSESEGNPNPSKPHATIIEASLTQITFAIDIVSTLNISTVSQTIPNEWIVNTDSGSADQYSPALALGTDNNYYFAWQDFRNFASRIYGQRYSGQSAQWGSDLAVTSTNNQSAPQLTIDNSNNIYFVWHDDRDGHQDIYFDKYNSSGGSLWAEAKKINTDLTSADQQYPKIIFNASTTAPAVYVAWKDDRVGSGQSDIYLQKFSINGNPLWSSELKVNLNSSSQYQISDSTTWTFDNPLNYICDDGSCDGTTDIEVTGGLAQLVSIKTCNGTANSCDSFVDQPSCAGQSGCSFDDSGPCEDGSCDCSLITDEGDCDSTASCSWQAGTPSCTGNCSCGSVSRPNCLSVPGCSLFWLWCWSNPGCVCEDINNQAVCEDANCNWGTGAGICQGSCSCSNITTGPICTTANCNWDTEGPCSGTADSCDTFLTQATCEGQSDCEWSGSGTVFPDDEPEIYLVESFSVPDLVSWDSFTETATKNGGEIYYQLSDDDGSSWRYWNNNNWVIAGTSNYNTASTINSNLGAFPTDRGKIMFKAFLSSNGNQQIQLDQVDIGYTNTTSGGGYSQSVDLAVDDLENVYVVWEDYQIDNYDIFVQKVDLDGNIIWLNDIRVNTSGSGNQNNPAIDIGNDDNLYIVWQDNRSGDDDIYAQKYDSSGNALWSTGDIAITAQAGSTQKNPKTIVNSSNEVFVVWQDSRNEDNDIYGQKINSGATLLWPNDIRINSNSAGDQRNPDLILNQANNLVVTWQDNNGGNYDILAAEYPGDPASLVSVPNVPLVITGSKLVGSGPDVYKYNENHSTNGSGNLTISNLEWDTYNITLQGGSIYTIVSSEPPLPISLDPGETQNITINLD